MQKSNMCCIPVSATYRKIDGHMVKISAEYAEIPADEIAKFLIQKMGGKAIFQSGEVCA